MPCNHVSPFYWPANACSMMRIGIRTRLCKDIVLILHTYNCNIMCYLICYYLAYYYYSYKLTALLRIGAVLYRHDTKSEHGRRYGPIL